MNIKQHRRNNFTDCVENKMTVEINSLFTKLHYSAFQTFRQSAFRERNEITEYFAWIQYDFQKGKPKTISEIHSKGVKSSRLSNLMRFKVL